MSSPWEALLAEVRVDADAAHVGDVALDWAGLDAPARRSRLTRALYERFHVGGPATLALQADEHYCASLDALHQVRSIPEDGWEPAGPARSGHIRMRRAGVFVDVPVDTLDAGAVRMPSVRWRWTLGFLGFLSSHGRPTGAIGRFYLHLSRAGVRRVAPALLAALEADGRPYLLKTANNPQLLELRRDATVLYVPLSTADAAWGHLRDLAGEAGWLDGTSRLARQLAPGIGWGVEPSDPPAGASSFGLHRADLLARYLLDRRGTLADFLRAHGVDPAAPHLELGVPEAVAS